MAACRSTRRFFFAQKRRKANMAVENCVSLQRLTSLTETGRGMPQSLPGEGGFELDRIYGSESRDPDSPDTPERGWVYVDDTDWKE